MQVAVTKLLKFIGWSYLAYLLISLLVLLPALNIIAPWATREFLDRELQHELIIYNPFTVAVELRGATLHEKDGHVPIGLRKARVDLSMTSIWRDGIVLDEIRVEELDVHVVRYAEGGFHFDDLLGTDEAPPDDDAGLPGITIEDVFLGAHTLRFTDRTRRGTYTAAYRDFDVTTNDISTLPGRSGDGQLTIRGAGGGVLRWQGELNIADGESVGRLAVEKLDLTHVWEYGAEDLPFVVSSALLDIDVNYSVGWLDTLRFSASESSVGLHDLHIVPNDNDSLPETALNLGEFTVSGITVDSEAALVNLADVALKEFDLEGFDQGERLSILEMLLPPGLSAAPTEESSAGDSVEEAASDESAPWQLSVERFSMEDSGIIWRSERLSPQPITIHPIELQASSVSWPARGSSPVALALSLNGESTLNIDGAIHAGDGDGSLVVALETLPLTWFNPLLATSLRADIQGGLLSVNGEVQLSDFAPAMLGGDLALRSFAMRIYGAEDSALAFDAFTVENASLDILKSVATIDDVGLMGLRGGAHILKTGEFNIATAMIDQGADAAELETARDDTATAGNPWALRIGHIGIRDGQLNFSDASLPLPFATLIGDIEGDIRDLDSQSEQPLSATLNGAVDGYAPVVIEASGRPLADPRDARVTLSFRGMDIATMSPYSGTYAGYTIDSGTLSVDLGYAVRGTQLAGDNRIVISQMELGEPIESDRAMQLPLKLGLALLTDAEGVIDLDVPISGDVDDPKFSLGAVIGGAIANVIVKAATAPFRLLASLVDSDQDLENIVYDAGAATLPETGKSSLAALAEALARRPKLQLRIIGSTEPVTDRRALQEKALNASLLEEGLSADTISAKTGDYEAVLDVRYAALGLAPPEDGTPISLQEKFDTLRSRIELPQGTLQELGTDRAVEAKRELVVNGGIDAARIAVSYDKSLLMSGTKMSLEG